MKVTLIVNVLLFVHVSNSNLGAKRCSCEYFIICLDWWGYWLLYAHLPKLYKDVIASSEPCGDPLVPRSAHRSAPTLQGQFSATELTCPCSPALASCGMNARGPQCIITMSILVLNTPHSVYHTV